jgi:hypothetical protein
MPGKEIIMILLGILQQGTWAKKKLCVFTVTCQKNLGSVGRDYYYFLLLLSAKPEIVVSVTIDCMEFFTDIVPSPRPKK